MKLGIFLTAIIASVWLNTPAQSNFFEADFTKGKLPKEMETRNNGDVKPPEYLYRNGYTSDGWTVAQVGRGVYAAIAPSYSPDREPMNSLLATPFFTVDKAGAILRWEARSVMPGFEDSYDVIIREEESGNQETLFSVEKEADTWQIRTAPLEKYNGKSIRVEIVCRSTGGYMLAVSSLSAGVYYMPEWSLRDETRHFAEYGGECIVKGQLTNFGAPADNVAIICESGESVTTTEFAEKWETGETREFEFQLHPERDILTEYTLSVKSDGAEAQPLATSDMFASSFERTLIVDEGTGMWCNNCPDGILELEKLKRRFGNQIIELSTHANDPLECAGYWSKLRFYAVPYFKLNRKDNTAFSSTKYFEDEYNAPTIAHIATEAQEDPLTGKVTLHNTVRFAENTDNSSDRYRIGYTVSADFFSPDSLAWYQNNNNTLPKGEQYYFLPSRIPSQLARFDNVTCSADFAFTGLENSLPATIGAMEEITSDIEIEIPAITNDAKRVRAVAFIIDTDNGHIENAAAADITDRTGLKSATADAGNLRVSVSTTGTISLTGADPEEKAEITACTPDGQIIFRTIIPARDATGLRLECKDGIVIVTARTASGTTACKGIVKSI